MHIYGPAQVHGAQSVNAPHAPRFDAAQPAATPHQAADTVDISETGRLLELAAQLPEMRADRVAQIRAEIASGTYETTDKLDIALARLLDEIA